MGVGEEDNSHIDEFDVIRHYVLHRGVRYGHAPFRVHGVRAQVVPFRHRAVCRVFDARGCYDSVCHGSHSSGAAELRGRIVRPALQLSYVTRSVRCVVLDWPHALWLPLVPRCSVHPAQPYFGIRLAWFCHARVAKRRVGQANWCHNGCGNLREASRTSDCNVRHAADDGRAVSFRHVPCDRCAHAAGRSDCLVGAAEGSL
mmetsp:Transcript_53400/g.135513  ORF Transcript_53400/g.135513 Transcript_53400/m.135513 type:complete len:201 (+) Transcript_53400:245-847(+)